MKRTAALCILFAGAIVSCGQLAPPEHSDEAGQHLTPESVGARPVIDPAQFLPMHRDAIRAAASELRVQGEDPAEFFAEVAESNAEYVVLLHLWHSSAFKPENANVAGNPGGKCRDFYYDSKRDIIIETLYWQ